MRLLVATECRYLKDVDGVYSEGALGYKLLQRYLEVYEEVIVLARFSPQAYQSSHIGTARADGPGVSFIPLPDYKGPWQCLRKLCKLRRVVKEAIHFSDAVILRVPGQVGMLVWEVLRREKRPFGVEVIGDPWDVFASGSFRSIARPLIQRLSAYYLRIQCREAVAAAYVTENALQRRYPPGGWSTHYSSVDLPLEAFIKDHALSQRIAEWKVLNQSKNRPWRLIFVGSMNHLYKAPHVLLKAVACCLKEGVDLEVNIVGDGYYRSHLEKQAHRLGLTDRVHFLGRIPSGEAVRQEFDKADLFVLPSFQEGLPRAMIEAMARGLPCIGSKVGGIPELLPEENMVPPGDIFALAHKICEILKDTERMCNISIRNLEKAKDFAEDILRERRVEFYRYIREATEAWLKK